MESLSACTTKMELAVKEEAAIMKEGCLIKFENPFGF